MLIIEDKKEGINGKTKMAELSEIVGTRILGRYSHEYAPQFAEWIVAHRYPD